MRRARYDALYDEVFAEWFGEEPPGLDAVAAEIRTLIETSRDAS